MSDTDRSAQRREDRRWVKASDEDINAAGLCLHGTEPACASAAFHCHQAVEKLLKAALVDGGISFRKAHDLLELMAATLPVCPWIETEFGELQALTPWSIAYRYPSIEDDIEAPPSVEVLAATLEQIARLRGRVTAGWR